MEKVEHSDMVIGIKLIYLNKLMGSRILSKLNVVLNTHSAWIKMANYTHGELTDMDNWEFRALISTSLSL
jgi:hypothetical protein